MLGHGASLRRHGWHASGPAAAQYAADCTYVKMSLTVPWTLYFVFLAGVLIPFVVMIALAWRSAARPLPEPASAETEAPTPGAP